MKTKTHKRVFKDVDKLPAYIQEKAAEELENLKTALSLSELDNVIPMEGTDEPYYRLRFGNYRFLLYYDIETNTIKVLSQRHLQET